ncbi:hypothetical protein B5807_08334 [Epicoccum nigrum]|uniref:GPI anchored protein n=1 Tax=Epicoccum nigrum TaxID=105696 RepID=A0A1Y2LRJ7_EPING|nr:hypothetical protein B5807_08334 [Epicoccum nigrum]
MLRSTCLLVLGLVAAAWAQESSYTGPTFDPSTEPYFASTGLVIPTQTNLPAIEPTNAFSMATTISGIILPSTTARSSVESSRSSSHSASSHESSASASHSASKSESSAAASRTSSAPATQSTGAAVANRAGVVGAVAGGLLAGLALA